MHKAPQSIFHCHIEGYLLLTVYGNVNPSLHLFSSETHLSAAIDPFQFHDWTENYFQMGYVLFTENNLLFWTFLTVTAYAQTIAN